MKFTYRELYKCAEREAALRSRVYAKMGMTAVRERELEMMTVIASLLKDLADGKTLSPETKATPPPPACSSSENAHRR